MCTKSPELKHLEPLTQNPSWKFHFQPLRAKKRENEACWAFACTRPQEMSLDRSLIAEWKCLEHIEFPSQISHRLLLRFLEDFPCVVDSLPFINAISSGKFEAKVQTRSLESKQRELLCPRNLWQNLEGSHNLLDDLGRIHGCLKLSGKVFFRQGFDREWPLVPRFGWGRPQNQNRKSCASKL